MSSAVIRPGKGRDKWPRHSGSAPAADDDEEDEDLTMAGEPGSPSASGASGASATGATGGLASGQMVALVAQMLPSLRAELMGSVDNRFGWMAQNFSTMLGEYDEGVQTQFAA